jgi:hypothetical protein
VAGILAALVSLAYASPTDPSWIAGIYDHADYDDVVAFLLDEIGASSGRATMLVGQSPAAWVSLLEPGRVTQWTLRAQKNRGPPAEPSSGSVDRWLNSAIFPERHLSENTKLASALRGYLIREAVLPRDMVPYAGVVTACTSTKPAPVYRIRADAQNVTVQWRLNEGMRAVHHVDSRAAGKRTQSVRTMDAGEAGIRHANRRNQT